MKTLIKVSQLREYMLKDYIIDASSAYVTIGGEQYVKEECLKTYRMADNWDKPKCYFPPLLP